MPYLYCSNTDALNVLAVQVSKNQWSVWESGIVYSFDEDPYNIKLEIKENNYIKLNLTFEF